MLSFVRIVFAVILGGVGAALLWWFLERVGFLNGIPIVGAVKPWQAGMVLATLAGLGEIRRIVVEQRSVRQNLELAETLHCAYSDNVSAAEIQTYPCSTLFRQDSPGGRHRISGTRHGRSIDVFDFRYMVRSDEGHGEIRQTVYRFPNAASETLCFVLKPQHPGMKLLVNLFGQPTVQLAPPEGSDPDLPEAYGVFHRKYQLSAPPAALPELRHWFSPPVVTWFADHQGWSIEVQGGELVAWKASTIAVGPDRLSRLEELEALLALQAPHASSSDRAARSRLTLTVPDRREGLGTTVGLLCGVLLGFLVGSFVAIAVLGVLFVQDPQNVPQPVVTGPLFVGSLFLSMAAGAWLGHYLGRRFARRKLPEPDDPRPETSSEFFEDAG